MGKKLQSLHPHIPSQFLIELSADQSTRCVPVRAGAVRAVAARRRDFLHGCSWMAAGSCWGWHVTEVKGASMEASSGTWGFTFFFFFYPRALIFFFNCIGKAKVCTGDQRTQTPGWWAAVSPLFEQRSAGVWREVRRKTERLLWSYKGGESWADGGYV